jgi:hypothetical protein
MFSRPSNVEASIVLAARGKPAAGSCFLCQLSTLKETAAADDKINSLSCD